MNADNHVYAIVLAAGASTRLGSPKQLLTWGNHSLLEHAILNARAIFQDRVIVVLGANNEAIQTAVNLDSVTTVINADWQQGMATSIQAGIHALPASATAALIVLCDQPLINTHHLQNLLNHWQKSPSQIVASKYHQSVGVPALFPAEFFEQLLMLKGDKGAKSLLLKYEANLLTVPMPEAELDIDSKGDFDYLLAHHTTDRL
jgi:molybdenum cofactor cytidylyltransferase